MTRRPIDAEFVFELPGVGQPAVRPDGGAIAYVAARTDRERMRDESQLELLPFAGGASRPLTAGPFDSAPAWSPDGTELAFLRRADAEARPQLWLLPMVGGEPRALSDLPGGLGGGLNHVTWAPDGASLLCVADVDPAAPPADAAASADEVPRARVVPGLYYRGDTLGWRGRTRRQLFRVDAATGQARQLTRGDYDHHAAVLSPDGTRIAFASDRSRGRELRAPFGAELCLLPAVGGRVTRLVRDAYGIGSIAWSPDGTQLAYTAIFDNNRWQAYLHVLDLATREQRRLTDDALAPQTGFFPLTAPPPLVWWDGRIVFAAEARGASGLYAASLDGRVETLRAAREATGGLSASADGSRLAFVASSPERPAELTTLTLRRDRRGARTVRPRARRVTAVAAGYLADHQPGRVERVRFRRSGLPIEGLLTFPPGFDAARRYPLVLEVHGGPNAAHLAGFSPLHQLIAGGGALVLALNPRGSTGYGADFSERVLQDWGGEDFADLMAALDRVCRRRYVDPSRLGIHGYSYGGYMATWAVAHSDRFRAAVAGAPVTSLASMYGQTDIPVSFGEQQWGGPPHERREWYAQRSPLTHARSIRTPLLLLHGEDDIRVPISQSEELYVALRRRGQEVEFVRFPGCSHLFLRAGHPALRREYYARVAAWFGRWL